MLGYYRIILAIGVLFAHAGGLLSDGVSRVMVSAFFIVSGYLMALTLSENYGNNPLPFYWNRFLRIYPLYFFLFIFIFLLAPDFTAQKISSVPDEKKIYMLLEALILTFNSAGLIIGPAWTLSYEILFYLLAPFLIFVKYQKFNLGFFLLFIVGGAFVVVHKGLSALLYPFALGLSHPLTIYASYFMFGLGGSLYFLSRFFEHFDMFFFKNSTPFRFAPFLILSIIFFTGSRFFSENGHHFDQEFGTFIGGAGILATIIILLSWSRQESKQSKLCGDLTYPVYLIHWPLIHTGLFDFSLMRELNQYLAHMIYLGDYILLGFLVLFFSGVLSLLWLQIEQNFIHQFRWVSK